jgi:hypothetical protein
LGEIEEGFFPSRTSFGMTGFLVLGLVDPRENPHPWKAKGAAPGTNRTFSFCADTALAGFALCIVLRYNVEARE